MPHRNCPERDARPGQIHAPDGYILPGGMTEPTFWKLIELSKQASGGDQEKQVALLTQRLSEMPVEHIVAFDGILKACLRMLYQETLWHAASTIHGGFCSDDG